MTGIAPDAATRRRGLALPRDFSVMGVFAVQSLASGGMYIRIPDMQTAIGLDAAELGVAIMGQPIGALTMFVFSSRLIETFGTRRVLLLGIPLLAFAPFAMALANSLALLLAGFFLFGLTFALTNVAMNVEADRVEAALDRRIMNTCHGIWSLAFLATSLLAAGARGFGVSPLVHFGLFLPLAVAAALAVMLPMQPSPPRGHSGSGKRKVFAVPTVMTLLLVGFGLSGGLMEGASRAWSVIYMRDSFDLPAWLESMTLPAFLITMTAGRLMADKWIARFGSVRVAFVLITIALIGLVGVVLAQNLWQALIGFGMIGFGVCVTFPMTLSAAARLGDRPSSENVAAVTMTMTLTLLATPALLGLVAEQAGIRMVFAVLIPFLVLSLFLARYLSPRETV